MIIDIHIHEKTFSWDSEISLEEIVVEAQKKGLDGVCITDHNSIGIVETASKIQQKCGFTIIIGAEILTYEGDILVFGLNELPNRKMHADELLCLVVKQGGVGIAAHPYRDNNRGLGDNILKLADLSGFEVLNGRTEYHNNVKAFEIFQRKKEPGFGGSDAHQLNEVGKCATYFNHNINNEWDLINAIKSKRFEPMIYEDGMYKRVKRGLTHEKNNSFSLSHSFGI